jgi:hypothetical protein
MPNETDEPIKPVDESTAKTTITSTSETTTVDPTISTEKTASTPSISSSTAVLDEAVRKALCATTMETFDAPINHEVGLFL